MSAWVAYSAYKTIQEKERRIEEGWDPVPVVVAIKNLTAGTELNYDHVAKKMIPSQVVTPNTILPPDFEKVIGKKLKVSVVRGDTLLWSMFSQEIFEAEVLPKSPEPEEPPAVVVAIQDLAVGTALDYGIIAKMRMEKEKQPSGAVTPKDVEGLLGGKLLVPVKRGEILLKSMLAPKKK
jgi:Flp pilus assembly protein CpaB